MFSYGFSPKNDHKQVNMSSQIQEIYKLKTKEYRNAKMNKSTGYFKNSLQSNQQSKSPQITKNNNQQYRQYAKKIPKYAQSPKQKEIKYHNYDPSSIFSKQSPRPKAQTFTTKRGHENYDLRHDWQMASTLHYPSSHNKQQAQRNIFKQVNNRNEALKTATNNEVKRQTIRHKDIQYRMNNIQNINVKIQDLLSLVNKKVEIGQRPKSYLKHPSTQYQKINTSPYNKQYPQHSPEIKSFRQGQSDKPHPKQQKEQKAKQKGHEGKLANHSSSLQRLRQLSIFEVSNTNLGNNSKNRVESKYAQNLNKTKEQQHRSEDDEQRRERAQTNYNMINERNREQNKYGYNYYRVNTNDNLRDNIKKIYEVSPRSNNGKANDALKQYRYVNEAKSKQIRQSIDRQRMNSFDISSPPNPNHTTQDGYLPISHKKPSNNTKAEHLNSKTIDHQVRQIRSKTNHLSHINTQCYKGLVQDRQKINNQRKKSGQKQMKSPRKPFEIKLLPVINDKQQTIKIAERLLGQVELDSLLRKIKQETANIQGQQLWRDLQVLLNGKGIKLTSFQIKSLMRLQQKEKRDVHVSDIQKLKRQIVELLCCAHQHWQCQVLRCSTTKSLKNEGFSVSHLDSKKKGYLNAEDLCDFVLDYTGRTVSEEDMFMIIKRLEWSQGKKNALGIQYNSFLRAVAI